MATDTPLITVLVAQFPVTLNIQHNLDSMTAILSPTEPDTLVIFPEGALSGYAEDPAFLGQIDIHTLHEALQMLRKTVTQHAVHLVFGSCLYERGAWYNAGLYYGPREEEFIYRKVNLATHERGVFTAGTHLPVFELYIQAHSVKLGVQLCREIRFPEQWQYLARAGAELFAYLTNAVGDASQAPIWRSHLISRAAENQRFVLCTNNAHAAQKCPSMIITPGGNVLWETCTPALEIGRQTLDLSEVSNWYLSQSRRDIIERATQTDD